MPTTRKAVTFSIPPELAEQVQQRLKEEGRTMSEFLRDAIRLYMEEREWLRRERRERAEAHQAGLEQRTSPARIGYTFFTHPPINNPQTDPPLLRFSPPALAEPPSCAGPSIVPRRSVGALRTSGSWALHTCRDLGDQSCTRSSAWYSCSMRSSWTLTVRKPDGSSPSG